MTLITSPIVFFRERMSTSSRGTAAVALLATAGAVGVVAAVSAQKTQPALDAMLAHAGVGSPGGASMGVVAALGGAATFLVLFLVHAFVLCCFYWISPSVPVGSAGRLVEFAGIAAVVRIPALVLAAVAMSMVEPISVPSSISESEIESYILDYQRSVASDTMVLVSGAIDVLSGICVACLRGVALYVVAGCPVPLAVTASVVGALFSVVPWAMGL